ncbi:MAG: RNA polymerase sigma factor [Prevotella sp.]
MAKTIQMNIPLQDNEARLVEGMKDKGRNTQYELYAYCSDYFWENYKGVFFADEEAAAEILQNTFIAFWENIEREKIFVENGVVMGKGHEPLKGSILTYFMSIARYKYMEYSREHPVYADPETELGRLIRQKGFDSNKYVDMMYDSGENMMLDIISDLISQMSPRCSQILTKYYYEEKKLEVILTEIPEIESYKALKSKKHKCMDTLRKSAKEIYHRRLNS